ncbi:hypothetical protein F4808DRAFT_462739 [Astrocystis sublimbata]|nr:hypothetical protein F4808DRAFT_462739 [Astrocystis sublimbata]
MPPNDVMDVDGPRPRVRITRNHNPYNTRQQAGMREQGYQEAAQLQSIIDRLRRQRDRAREDLEQAELELGSNESVFDSIRRIVQRPQVPQAPLFDPRTHQIVTNDFVSRSLQAHEEIKSLKEEVNKKSKEHDSVMSSWREALDELEEIKSSDELLVVGDDFLSSNWKHLRFIIKSLAITYVNGLASPNIGYLTEAIRQQMHELMPTFTLCPIEDESIVISQVLIWDFITDRVLNTPAIVWGQNILTSSQELLNLAQDNERVAAQDFHKFRAQIGDMINRTTDIDQTMCTNLKSELEEQLKAFISPEDEGEITGQLSNIIDKAFELAAMFARSRSYYEIKSIRHNKQLFDPITMDEVAIGDELDDPENYYIYSTITPMLFKYGNSKGKNYNERIVIAKASVICAAPS